MRKRIEASPLFDGQAAGQPPMHFPPCLMTHFDTKSFEHHRTWKNDPASPALLLDESSQVNQALVLNGSRQQPCRQFSGGTPSKWTKLQSVPKLSGMGLAVPFSSEIFADRFRENPDLFGNECEERFWRSFAGTERAAGIT
jgi:hypothetical protein